MNLYHFPEGQIIAFALVFLRSSGFVFSWPVFGNSNVPTPMKVLLALVFSLILFSVIPMVNPEKIKISEDILLLAIREVIIGVLLGYILRMFFFSISIMGEIVSVSMGLGSAQLYNPILGTQSHVVEQFQMMLATLLFLSIQGHHFMIMGLSQSFDILPIGVVGFKAQGFSGLTIITKEVIEMGLRMSGPIMVSIFVANIAMGVLGRTVPQINVMVTSLPVQILMGVFILILTMPLFFSEMNHFLDTMATEFISILKVL